LGTRVVAAAGTTLGVALIVRVIRSRRRRFLHPAGRSFTGRLVITGFGRPLGAELLERPGRYRCTVRLSKGAGTRGGRADVRGLAVRVHLPGRDLDLLFSTAGRSRAGRHFPLPRRSFDTAYGTITAYRTGGGRKVHLTGRSDPDGPALGRSLATLAEGDRLLLEVRHGDTERVIGRLTLGPALPPAADAALAYDPVRNSLPELHPSGLVHGTRAFAYRISQLWRGATPARPNPPAVARTAGHD